MSYRLVAIMQAILMKLEKMFCCRVIIGFNISEIQRLNISLIFIYIFGTTLKLNPPKSNPTNELFHWITQHSIQHVMRLKVKVVFNRQTDQTPPTDPAKMWTQPVKQRRVRCLVEKKTRWTMEEWQIPFQTIQPRWKVTHKSFQSQDPEEPREGAENGRDKKEEVETPISISVGGARRDRLEVPCRNLISSWQLQCHGEYWLLSFQQGISRHHSGPGETEQKQKSMEAEKEASKKKRWGGGKTRSITIGKMWECKSSPFVPCVWSIWWESMEYLAMVWRWRRGR